MHVLFALANVYLSEPLGAMMLMAIAKRDGHTVDLIDIKKHDVCAALNRRCPDVIAYSAMTADSIYFAQADQRVREWMRTNNRSIMRIMGGPHPTYAPGVIDELNLDAICQGDGDRAWATLLARLAAHQAYDRIPNIALTKEGAATKELVDGLDNLPYADREVVYQVAPQYRRCGLRSFITSRGCPYHCSYCFNHAFNQLFKGCGSIIRRRSVENVLAEIEYVVRAYPPVRMIRFGDDTFAHTADAWLEEFAENYARRIGIPFYCLMRSNTLTDDTARLLAHAGCCSMSMSLESGVERVRNQILKRHLSDEMVLTSFAIARKYRINVFANTMLAVPGTTIDDDFASLDFARRIRPAAPVFGICCPYPGTELWTISQRMGVLDEQAKVEHNYSDLSVLTCYTQQEKEMQVRMAFLGPVYCLVPSFLVGFIRWLIRSSISLKLCLYIGKVYGCYRIATRIFPRVIPWTPATLWQVIKDTMGTIVPAKGFVQRHR